MELLIEPVITGVRRLHVEAQLIAVSAAVTSLCEAWSTNILQHKIRFRYIISLHDDRLLLLVFYKVV